MLHPHRILVINVLDLGKFKSIREEFHLVHVDLIESPRTLLGLDFNAQVAPVHFRADHHFFLFPLVNRFLQLHGFLVPDPAWVQEIGPAFLEQDFFLVLDCCLSRVFLVKEIR